MEKPTCLPCQSRAFAFFRFRVAAAFLAEADRSAGERAAAAAPPILPPFSLETWVSGTPRPLPDLLPPPVSLLTVAQARRSLPFQVRLAS